MCFDSVVQQLVHEPKFLVIKQKSKFLVKQKLSVNSWRMHPTFLLFIVESHCNKKRKKKKYFESFAPFNYTG